jgi:ferredoxin
MHIDVDTDKCVGAGNCVFAAPSVFDQGDEDGIVVLLSSEPDADEFDAVKQAAVLCPAAAIHVSPNRHTEGKL